MIKLIRGIDNILNLICTNDDLYSILIKLFIYLLQIRQEKPYYIADPEVDSLVSTYICAHYHFQREYCTAEKYKRKIFHL